MTIYRRGDVLPMADGAYVRVVNPDWPNGTAPFCERIDPEDGIQRELEQLATAAFTSRPLTLDEPERMTLVELITYGLTAGYGSEGDRAMLRELRERIRSGLGA
jgi:hypothetical protein